MACRDMLVWVGDSYVRIDCGLNDVKKDEEDYCYLGPRRGKKRCYIHESEYRGCCRRIRQPPPWAISGKTRVFLVHPEDCHPHQGSLFGYFLLERFEIVVGPTTYAKLRDPDVIPWSDELSQDILHTVKESHDLSSLRGRDRHRLEQTVRKRFQKRSRQFAQEVAKRKREFRKPKRRSWPSPEELIGELLEEFVENILEEIIENWIEEVLVGRDSDVRWVSCEDGAGEPPRSCSGFKSETFEKCPQLRHKRTKPGATYVVDALAAEITDLFVEALKQLTEKHEKQPSLAEKERAFRRTVEEVRPHKTEKHQRRDVSVEIPDFVQGTVEQRGELVLFPQPFPVIQRCPQASFLGYLRVDGDRLLEEVRHSRNARNYLVKVPYCTGAKAEGPMTKQQLQAYFAGELMINQTLVGRFFEELLVKAAEGITQKGGFVLPGFGRFYLTSSGRICFRPYKSLQGSVSKSKTSPESNGLGG